jgi:hypothetical protein
MAQQASAFLFKLPPPLGDGGKAQDLGSAEEVRRKISACFPTIDWSDPAIGIVEGEGFWFMFTMGEEETIEFFMVCARGGGIAFGPLRGLASRWGWHMLDFSQGE